MKRIIPALVLFCISTHFVAAQTLPAPTRLETEKGAAKKQQAGTNAVLTPNGGADEKPGQFDLKFKNIDMNQLLGIYAEVTGRSVLRFPGIPRTSLDLNASCTNLAEAARAIEKAFGEKGITNIFDGEKFVLVAPVGQMPAVTTNSPASIRPAKGSASQAKAIPAGDINFIAIDVLQTLPIYASLSGRKLVLTKLPGPGSISFRSQTPLSVEEALHALDTLLAWNGVKMVPVGDDSIKAVSISSP